MRVKIVPRGVLAAVAQEERILCLYARGLGARQISFITGLPLSTVYRKIAKLKKLGVLQPGIYIAGEAHDGLVKILGKPVLLLAEDYCAYIPERCQYDSCMSCPHYVAHLKALHAMGLAEGQYAEPRHLVEELVERVKKAVGDGFWVELHASRSSKKPARAPRRRRLLQKPTRPPPV